MNGDFPPKRPGPRLYDGLFLNCDIDQTLETISNGLLNITENVEGLLKDTELLVSAESFARAHFILATAEEEIAKAFILLDCCRLDFSSHEGPLKNLCSAFYDHIKKHAYYKIIDLTYKDFRFANMEHVREVFHLDLVHWWPADYEDGVPIMPHDTFFSREINLYVDFDWQFVTWVAPDDDYAKNWFGYEDSDDGKLNMAKTVSTKFKATKTQGLFKSEVLKIINDTFKGLYCTEATLNAELSPLFKKQQVQIEKSLLISTSDYENSVLEMWPMYHFPQNFKHPLD